MTGPSTPPGRSERQTLLVFLKAPEPGGAKTRLARDVGRVVAAAIYRELAEIQLAQAQGPWRAVVHFAPASAEAAMRGWLGNGPDYLPQPEGDLGARMASGFEAAFSSGATAVVAIGGDCPDLGPNTLAEAFQKLGHTDAVLGPAADGGYYLIGLRRPAPQLFSEVSWGTDFVLNETVDRVLRSGRRLALLGMKEDIDDGASWARLVRRRAEAPAPGRLAVIIPTLNEAGRIAGTVSGVRGRLPGAAVIVADGGSSDATAALAAAAGATVVRCARGRGTQCRAGAAAAGRVEWMLFLHADTELPEDARPVIARFLARPDAHAATFRLRFDRAGPFLRLCAWFSRFDSLLTRFGDQGILVRRSLHDTLGGFADWPLLEDVDFLRRVRSATRLHSLGACVTTSARRFEGRGAVRQQLLNAWLLARFAMGASPEALAAAYERDPRGTVPQPPSGPEAGAP